MPTNDFLPIATDPGAYVDTQAAFAGSGYQLDGLQPGITLGRRLNKMIRQGSVGSAVLGELVKAVLGQNFLDNGDLATQVSQVEAMINSLAATGGAPGVDYQFHVPPNPINWAVSRTNQVHPVFEVTLVGPGTSTVTGLVPGQFVTFIINQDGVGGRTFTPPAGIPMDPIDTTPNQTCIQSFHVLKDGSVLAAGPMSLKI